MRKIYFFTISMLVATMFLFSCNHGDNNNSDADTTSPKQDKHAFTKNSSLIPSPIELFLFLKQSNARFDVELLNSVDNLSKYQSSQSKAINFGIYASDLAYSTVFEEPQKTFFYYKATKTLADELGLTEGFDEKITKRINDNINNTDSLYNITNDANWEVRNFLERQGKNDVLSYIIVGGWVESLHIAINSVKKFDANDKIVLRIAEQQLLIENLIEEVKAKKKDAEIDDILKKLTDLQSSFDKLYDNTGAVKITEAQFKEIAQKVEALRKELVS